MRSRVRALAWDALGETIEEARSRKKIVTTCAILLAAGRSLPELPKILASHPLIHTAEGEFFRQSFRSAGERLKLQVTGIRERDLDEHALEKFGGAADSVKREIAGLGSSLCQARFHPPGWPKAMCGLSVAERL
ncbi:MAG: hypothetical protein WBE37_02620 [Bryobacteraceae bacterium]